MTDISAPSFVRQDLVTERAAPAKTTGFIGFLRTRLLNSPGNVLLTILGLLLAWYIVIPAVKFLLVDAVWTGKDRTACLAEQAGHQVGAVSHGVVMPKFRGDLVQATVVVERMRDGVRPTGVQVVASVPCAGPVPPPSMVVMPE